MPDERPKSLSHHGVDILSGLRRPAEPLSAPMRPPGLPLLSWEVEAMITQTLSLNQAWVITVNGGSPGDAAPLGKVQKLWNEVTVTAANAIDVFNGLYT